MSYDRANREWKHWYQQYLTWRGRAERAEDEANDALRNYWNQHEELAEALDRAERAEALADDLAEAMKKIHPHHTQEHIKQAARAKWKKARRA